MCLMLMVRLNSLKDYVNAVLADPNFTTTSDARMFAISAQDWELMEKCIAVLQPFYDATTMLSGSEYCSVTLVHPALETLKNHLEVNRDVDTHAIISLKTVILRKINDMFFFEEG